VKLYLGSILEVRDHSNRPLRVQFNLGDGTLDAGWLMVAAGAWNAVRRGDLREGVQCLVLDTLHENAEQDRWRVLEIWPTGSLVLDDTEKHLARDGDAVAIKGNPVLTIVDVIAGGGLPMPVPTPTALLGKALGHDLRGEVKSSV
jgi:hypothetical protein